LHTHDNGVGGSSAFVIIYLEWQGLFEIIMLGMLLVFAVYRLVTTLILSVTRVRQFRENPRPLTKMLRIVATRIQLY
jgi:hypothetical protein